MKIGIYKLIFIGTEYVYIGQSRDIDARYVEHIANLRLEKANYKLMAAYILFNEPQLEIVELCSEELLDEKEQYYINIYDSINKGLNISLVSHTPIVDKGYIPHNSKYSENQYLELLKYLIENYELSNKEISKNTNIDINTVNKLRTLKGYGWLKIRYPELYSELEGLYEFYGIKPKNIVVAPTIKKVYSKLISPQGVEYTIEFGSVHKFAKQHNINYSGLNKVLNKKLKHISGWTLAL